MCLIIFTPDVSKSTISEGVLERAFRLNPDGAGMAFVEGGDVIIRKAYFKFSKFLKAYKRLMSTMEKGPLLIHFRLATCGHNSHTNTHPIPITRKKLVMAHNGIFSHLSIKDSDFSDSVRYAKLIKNLGWALPLNKAQIEMLELTCEYSSKVVLLDNKGNYQIINDFMGTWKKGAWYSNNYSFTEKKLSKRQQQRAAKKGDYSPYDDDDERTLMDEDVSYLELIKEEMKIERERRDKMLRMGEGVTVRAAGTFMPRQIVRQCLQDGLDLGDPDPLHTAYTGYEGYIGD